MNGRVPFTEIEAFEDPQCHSLIVNSIVDLFELIKS